MYWQVFKWAAGVTGFGGADLGKLMFSGRLQADEMLIMMTFKEEMF